MSQKQAETLFRADLTDLLDMPNTPIRLVRVGVLDYLYCKDKIISQHRPGDYSVNQLKGKALSYLKGNGHYE